jgi:3-(3-hydroxy-phenyl)propionate hydroxylase
VPGAINFGLSVALSRANANVEVAAIVVARRMHPASQADEPRLIEDRDGLLAKRFDATPGTLYLRPDQHLCARWRSFSSERVIEAIAPATHIFTTQGASMPASRLSRLSLQRNQEI